MAQKVLVTGACGMIGSHLVGQLLKSGHHVVATHYRPTTDINELPSGIELLEMDLRYGAHVSATIANAKPDVIFHLGAQSYPTVSWARPQETIDVNVTGTANVFEAIKFIRNTDKNYNPVVVTACSSAEYGSSLLQSDAPIKEDAQLLPLHPYGVSKVATDLLSYQYFMSDNIRSIRARIFNTSGPRKQGDVISDFARRVAALPKQGGTLRVGNLKTRRAFLHVNDTVAALIALAETGQAGEVYNISGIEVVSIAELLPMYTKVSSKNISTELDQTLLRPTDEPIIWGDISRIKDHTGWRPHHKVEDIVRDVYAYESAKRARLAPSDAC
jgi:GDP-4-dehydro-6-deoxy-D-mannose reductase